MSKLKVNSPLIWVIVTILVSSFLLTQYYEFAMMGLTTFILAYLSKGIRRKKVDHFNQSLRQ